MKTQTDIVQTGKCNDLNLDLLKAAKIGLIIMLKYQDLLGSCPLTDDEHESFYIVEQAITQASL